MNRTGIACGFLAGVTLAFAACGGSSSGRTSGTNSTRTSAATPAATPQTGTLHIAANAPAWPTYGGSNSRSGVVPGAPAKPKLHRRFQRGVDGEIYAQPLIAGGRVYVATENNTVYSFTTAGKLVWKRHLGAPVPGGDLPCGNIDPSGITATPVIAGDRLFTVAFLHSGHKHALFGLRLGDGGIATRTNVDPPNPTVEQARGALLDMGGRIYVPYGGLYGDCGSFRGYIVSRNEGGGGRTVYRNPSTEAGIWAPAGLSAQSGTLLVSTGNGATSGFAYQNSAIRLTPDLHRVGYWAPTNWSSLSAGDVDEGSLAPLPVSRGRVFQIGKDGVGYLLRHGLGGVGHHKFKAQVCGGEAFGADAFRAPLAIVPCGDSLYGLRIGANRFKVAWRSDAGGLVPLIVGGSVFAVTRDGTLNQLRFTDGHQLASVRVGSGRTSFPAAAAAQHTLVVPAGREFVVFSI